MEIETEIKKIFQQRKAQGQITSQVNFTKNLGKKLTFILLKCFQKIAEEGNSQTHTIRPAFQNQSEMSQKKKIRGQYHGDEYRYKNPQQYDSKEN